MIDEHKISDINFLKAHFYLMIINIYLYSSFIIIICSYNERQKPIRLHYYFNIYYTL